MPDFDIEDNLRLPSPALIAGVDEVGRGPLAGPVTAAAVVLHRAKCPNRVLSKINDSKKLNVKTRQFLFDEIQQVSAIGIGWANTEEIDRKNIHWATMLAMQRAIIALERNLPRKLDFALIDGNRVPELNCSAKSVVKGDAKSMSIAAASIIAKCTRDSYMNKLSKRYPGYGWDRNAGYGTREHLDALNFLGLTDQHRRSFGPIARQVTLRPRNNAYQFVDDS